MSTVQCTLCTYQFVQLYIHSRDYNVQTCKFYSLVHCTESCTLYRLVHCTEFYIVHCTVLHIVHLQSCALQSLVHGTVLYLYRFVYFIYLYNVSLVHCTDFYNVQICTVYIVYIAYYLSYARNCESLGNGVICLHSYRINNTRKGAVWNSNSSNRYIIFFNYHMDDVFKFNDMCFRYFFIEILA